MYFLSLSFVYVIGTFAAMVSVIGEAIGVIKVSGWENFPHGEGGVELVSTHPSLMDWLIVIPLFRKDYLRHPVRLGPSTYAEIANYGGFFYKLCGPKIIYIDRSGGADPHEANMRALQRGAEIISAKGSVIIFGGGGRDGSVESGHLESPGGKKVRPCKLGPAKMAAESGAKVLCVYLEIDWLFGFQVSRKRWLGVPKTIWVTIAKPFGASGKTTGEIRREINENQLRSADATNTAK